MVYICKLFSVRGCDIVGMPVCMFIDISHIRQIKIRIMRLRCVDLSVVESQRIRLFISSLIIMSWDWRIFLIIVIHQSYLLLSQHQFNCIFISSSLYIDSFSWEEKLLLLMKYQLETYSVCMDWKDQSWKWEHFQIIQIVLVYHLFVLQ